MQAVQMTLLSNRFRWICLLLLLSRCCIGQSHLSPPRIVFETIQNSSSPFLNVSVTNDIIDKHKGYLALTNYMWSVVAFEECGGVEKTSQQAKSNSCQVATNGGPFESLTNGVCTGAVLMDGNVISGRFSSSSVGFGKTQGNRWVLGGLADENEAQQIGVTDFVTGFGWLVYNGRAVVSDNNPTGAVKAPRTAIGINPQGELLLLVVDGCQKCWRRKGATLQQMAETLVKIGAKHAINLDGGGSSTFVHDGEILNRPTCLDIPFPCERPVTTVMCLKEAAPLQVIGASEQLSSPALTK